MIRVHVMDRDHVVRIGAARVLFRPEPVPTYVEPETTPIPVVTMAELVYGDTVRATAAELDASEQCMGCGKFIACSCELALEVSP